MSPLDLNDALVLSRCEACQTWLNLAPYACRHCGGMRLQRLRSAGAGLVWARSEITRAPDETWRGLTPYVLVLVRLNEGPSLMGHACPTVALGDPVVGIFRSVGDQTVLRFEAVQHA